MKRSQSCVYQWELEPLMKSTESSSKLEVRSDSCYPQLYSCLGTLQEITALLIVPAILLHLPLVSSLSRTVNSNTNHVFITDITVLVLYLVILPSHTVLSNFTFTYCTSSPRRCWHFFLNSICRYKKH